MADLILRLILVPLPPGRPSGSPIGQGRSLVAQRYGRYVAGSAGHRDRTPPDLAATLIHRYSRPGDLIVDPFAGTGTMLVEAVHAGRDGLGLDIESGWVSLARANLALAARQGATGRARVIHADATRLPARVPTDLRGTVDLILTTAPAGTTMPAYRTPRCRTGISAPALGSPPHPRTGRIDVATGLTRVLAGCTTLLRPGGLAAIMISRDRHRRTLAGCGPGAAIRAGLRVGLAVLDHHYANHRGQLTSHFRGDDLTQPPLAATGAVILLPAVAAHDIVVFRKPIRGEEPR